MWKQQSKNTQQMLLILILLFHFFVVMKRTFINKKIHKTKQKIFVLRHQSETTQLDLLVKIMTHGEEENHFGR